MDGYNRQRSNPVCAALFPAESQQPLDVAKTRIMLAKRSHDGDLAKRDIRHALAIVFKERGASSG